MYEGVDPPKNKVVPSGKDQRYNWMGLQTFKNYKKVRYVSYTSIINETVALIEIVSSVKTSLSQAGDSRGSWVLAAAPSLGCFTKQKLIILI